LRSVVKAVSEFDQVLVAQGNGKLAVGPHSIRIWLLVNVDEATCSLLVAEWWSKCTPPRLRF
jgi:hypothetical protein